MVRKRSREARWYAALMLPDPVMKASDGGCSFYKLCTFKQNSHGGRYGGTYYGGHGDRVKIPCESVNK